LLENYKSTTDATQLMGKQLMNCSEDTMNKVSNSSIVLLHIQALFLPPTNYYARRYQLCCISDRW